MFSFHHPFLVLCDHLKDGIMRDERHECVMDSILRENSRLASLDYGVDIMFSSILATVAGMFSNGPAA